ncbi:MAG: hypothetical protein K2W82_04050 [Candidatus Obscuribacterales bacterium]|nr:hypothetical protein [Candidatus Obscuribacterales bacterium]
MLLLASAVLAIVTRKKFSLVCVALTALACVFLISGALQIGRSDSLWKLSGPFYLGVAPLSFRFDALSAVFSALLGLIALCAALFSHAYLKHLSGRINQKYYWCSLNLFVLGMLGVFLAANAITFLVSWEIMSLSSAALVVWNFSESKGQKAALIYLGATRLATAFLSAGFLWFHHAFDSWDFAKWHFNQADLLVPSMMVALGLFIKSGIWPFHIWLPYAHPSAPSSVSALMSGVMVKVAVYALLRFFLIDGSGSIYLAWVCIALGAISSFWGVLFAFVQSDIKKLLAYSTVENLGMIFLAAGICLYAQVAQLKEIAALAFVAVIFHSINHGLFKSLLFFCAGAIDSAVHSRKLDSLGGLINKMPATTGSFLIGSTAASALPPLNGFVGKWLIYQSLFMLAASETERAMNVLAMILIGLLSFVGGLALAVFAKMFAVVFLGRPRSPAAENASECSKLMNAIPAALAVLCLVCGCFAGPLITYFCRMHPLYSAVSLPSLPIGQIAFLFLAFAIFFYLAFLRKNGERIRYFSTWDCGYGSLLPKMQVNSQSFAHSVGTIFGHLLQYVTHFEIGGHDRRHFPERIKAETVMISLLESRIYGPALALVRLLNRHFSKLQAGSIHLYLLYVFLVLVAMIVIEVLA